MQNIEAKDRVQRKALDAWIKHNKKGTCEIITGLGKTFISLHALYTMPRDDKEHLFLAESRDRVVDLKKDIFKYNKIFNRDVLNDYNLQFYCYQTVYKWKNRKFGLVISDEIHDSLSIKYVNFYKNNQYDAILGLSATINRSTKYALPSGRVITKGDLLDKVAPVCFKYSVNEGQKEGTSRKLDIYIIQNELNSVNKNVKSGSRNKPFYQTELQAYNYWDKEHRKAWFIEDQKLKELKISITAKKRSDLLFNLNSKIEIVKKLLIHLKNKTIIFGNSIPALSKVTKNVVSSKNSDDKNNKIRDDFDKGLINTIGSFKKLKQGANLLGLDNCIIMSYYGSDKDFIQRTGRLRDNGEIGKVFIILTKDTQEEVWFSKMFENSSNLNLIYCSSVEDCLKQI